MDDDDKFIFRRIYNLSASKLDDLQTHLQIRHDAEILKNELAIETLNQQVEKGEDWVKTLEDHISAQKPHRKNPVRSSTQFKEKVHVGFWKFSVCLS